MPDKVMAAIAEDWVQELSDYPEWALQKAFRWWIGRENEKRRQKPVPGDISDRAYVEMSIVRAAKIKARLVNAAPVREAADPPATPEQAAEILKDVGFSPKRVGAGE